LDVGELCAINFKCRKWIYSLVFEGAWLGWVLCLERGRLSSARGLLLGKYFGFSGFVEPLVNSRQDI